MVGINTWALAGMVTMLIVSVVLVLAVMWWGRGGQGLATGQWSALINYPKYRVIVEVLMGPDEIPTHVEMKFEAHGVLSVDHEKRIIIVAADGPLYG